MWQWRSSRVPPIRMLRVERRTPSVALRPHPELASLPSPTPRPSAPDPALGLVAHSAASPLRSGLREPAAPSRDPTCARPTAVSEATDTTNTGHNALGLEDRVSEAPTGNTT